jgi:hypothetical protein
VELVGTPDFGNDGCAPGYYRSILIARADDPRSNFAEFAGAALAYGVLGGGDHQAWAMLAALAGGSLAASSHAAKASTRAAVNHSPEPFSNWGLSLVGDAFVPGLLWLCWVHPGVALGVVLVLVLVMWCLTWFLWRFIVRLWRSGRPEVVH